MTTAAFRNALLAFFAMGFVVIALAEEPASGGRAAKTPQAVLNEGLGFSIAPRGGGKARTEFFGLAGEGYKFVYVVDRSGSMSESGDRAWRAAKAELIASLKNLDNVHQFQIVLYNERPAVFHPTGVAGRLVFATDGNKDRAERFLESMAAEGGTNHWDALRTAIRMRPDVIFFLTDADDPKLSVEELARIRDMAAGIVIHGIEFGVGSRPASGDASFIAQLARQNGGGYVYVDVTAAKTSNGR